MTTGRLSRWLSAFAAAALVAWGATLPLWTLTMRAPQYPKGLQLQVYGTGMTGDISELDILNHYIGMPPITAPDFETSMFPYGIGLLVVLCVVSAAHVHLRRLAILAAVLAPLSVLVDLQWRLYTFGHSLDPTAPIRLKPFTPLVLGQSAMGNFVSTGMVAAGFWCLIGAALMLVLPQAIGRLRPAAARRATASGGTAAAAAILALALVAPASPAAQSRPVAGLQQRLDAAARGATVVVEPGTYAGPIVIRGPLTVVAPEGATIDGQGRGSVVTIEGRGVRFSGFTVRNSGRDVTEEAAGITVTGDDHSVDGNRVEDVYFGIHLDGGARVTVRGNTIRPGERHGARPGHGINAWNLRDSEIADNDISEARDGVYLSFTERVRVVRNVVESCRYGLHSMYSRDATFEANRATANLLGAALMMSDGLVLRGNRIERHRRGAAAYGLLLKDIGDLTAEGNLILSNRIGVYAETVPKGGTDRAILAGNVIAGNEVGLALQSTAALTLTGNRIADNLADVRALGRQLSADMRWSRDGRGNSWGQYRGFDADRDGIGDVPHQIGDAMDALIQRNGHIQAFLYTPAHLAVEAAVRMFPLYRRPPLVVDPHPVMDANAGGSR